jgi:hypothetical protein
MTSQTPSDIIRSIRFDIDDEYLKTIDQVENNWDKFVKWPVNDELLLAGVDRTIKYHTYPDELIITLKGKKIALDTRSNGPAIAAYLNTGGMRPQRKKSNRQWSIHHIYDGQFPWPGRDQTLHAVKNGSHFSRSGGLVAIHPIADALADEFSYFAWLLRMEAFKRFKYDPDNIFTT